MQLGTPLTLGILVAAAAVVLVLVLLAVCIFMVVMASKPRHDDERD
jgi:hypothetical protein